MKTFANQCAQGDLLIIRVAVLPEGLPRLADWDGVLAHSETGHHHVIDRDVTEMYRLPDEIYECFIVVREPTALRHLRSWDTHEPIAFEPGIYRVRRQREYTPQGMRRVED